MILGTTPLNQCGSSFDTVNGEFPDVGADNGPRQRIIDSAFKMTEQLVGASTQLAEKIVKASQDALAYKGGVPRAGPDSGQGNSEGQQSGHQRLRRATKRALDACFSMSTMEVVCPRPRHQGPPFLLGRSAARVGALRPARRLRRRGGCAPVGVGRCWSVPWGVAVWCWVAVVAPFSARAVESLSSRGQGRRNS